MHIPLEIRENIFTRPLPRHMHPVYNSARRQARTRALDRELAKWPEAVYCDAAEYRHHNAYALVVTRNSACTPLSTLTILTTSPTTAEEAAIALALTQRPTPPKVVTDSKLALLHFVRGTISSEALRIILSNPPQKMVELVWAPAHTGLPGNELAHAIARDLTLRAGVSIVPRHGARSSKERLITFNDIVEHYRLSRRTLSPAHSSLTPHQTRYWRLLQTDSFPCRARLHHIHPASFPSPNCPQCGQRATLEHSMWACPYDPFPQISSSELWREALGSSSQEIQEALVRRATEVAAGLRPAATNPQ